MADRPGPGRGARRGFRLLPVAVEQLRRRELLRLAQGLADELGRPFAEAGSGERIDGVYRRRVDLLSGRFALIERAHDFTLVPWRQVLERHVGKAVSGMVRGDGVGWTIVPVIDPGRYVVIAKKSYRVYQIRDSYAHIAIVTRVTATSPIA